MVLSNQQYFFLGVFYLSTLQKQASSIYSTKKKTAFLWRTYSHLSPVWTHTVSFLYTTQSPASGSLDCYYCRLKCRRRHQPLFSHSGHTTFFVFSLGTFNHKTVNTKHFHILFTCLSCFFVFDTHVLSGKKTLQKLYRYSTLKADVSKNSIRTLIIRKPLQNCL